MADDRLKLNRTFQPRETTSPRPAPTEAPVDFPRPKPEEVAQVKETLFRDPERPRGNENFRELRRELMQEVRRESRENRRELEGMLRESVGLSPDSRAVPLKERPAAERAPVPEHPAAPERPAMPERERTPGETPHHHDGSFADHWRGEGGHFERMAPEKRLEQKADLLEAVDKTLSKNEEQHAPAPETHAQDAQPRGGEPRPGLLRTEAGQIPNPGGEAHHPDAHLQDPQLANQAGQPVIKGKAEGESAPLPGGQQGKPGQQATTAQQGTAGQQGAQGQQTGGQQPGSQSAPGSQGAQNPHGAQGEKAAGPHAEPMLGPPPKPVSKLVPDLKKLTQAEEVPNRFLKDLVAARSPLLEGGLPKEQRASRLFGFFSHYAERFVTLAKGFPDTPQTWGPQTKNEVPVPTAPALPQAKKDTAVEQFLGNLKEVGFSQLRDRNTGNTGLQTAKQMLEAESPRDVQRQARDTALVVVGREAASSSSARGNDGLAPPFNPDGGILNGNRRLDSPQDWVEERRRRRSYKVLGSNMLWNILHLERSPNETMTKDELNRLAFGAILVLFGVTLMVVLLVNLN